MVYTELARRWIVGSSLSLLIAGCAGSTGPSTTADRDQDGVVDAYDAHPDQATSEEDRAIEHAVRAHHGKAGLVTAAAVGLRVDQCRQSPSRAVEITAAHPTRTSC